MPQKVDFGRYFQTVALNSLRRLRAARNFSQVSLLLLLALAADRRRSLCSLSSAMAGPLNHGAGGRVTFVNFNGACLSIHSLINQLNISSFSSGSETPKEAANGSVLNHIKYPGGFRP